MPGSYQQKNGFSLEQFAAAVDSIGQYEHFTVVDSYHKNNWLLNTGKI